MDNTKKTSLEEAKASYEQIKKFATEAAKKELEIEINKSVEKLLKESLSVEMDDENNITIATDKKVVELTSDGEIEVEDIEKHDSEKGEEPHFDNDNEEIEIDENMTFEQENPQPAPGAEAQTPGTEIPMQDETPVTDAPSKTIGEPTEESPASDEAMQIAKLIEKMVKKISGEDDSAQGVDVEEIDDEAQSTDIPSVDDGTAPPPAAPAPAPEAPVQEENELLEFALEEISGSDDEIDFDYDINAKNKAFDDISGSEEYASPEDSEGELEFEIVSEEEDTIEEMHGHSLAIEKGTLGKLPRQGTSYRKEHDLQESTNKIKAQYESKLDELLKENRRLNESNKEFGEVIKNYQDSFKGLRKQFDEMQTFNAKLAYANKIFAGSGLSVSDKAMIAEEFDKAQTAEDAKKLYNKIIKENKTFVNKENNVSKIKAITTNTIKAKDVVYESTEMKRQKVLAGIEKNEDFI